MLTYPKRVVFLPTVSNEDIGVFGDTSAKLRILNLKKEGVQIPGTSFVANDLKNITVTNPMDGDISVAKSCTDFGAVAGKLIEIAPVCPCLSECDYEYGIIISKQVENPGVNNNDRYPREYAYNGKLNSVDCTNGVIDDSYVRTMEEDLITQITGHIAHSSDSGSVVNAKRVVHITDLDNDDNTNGLTVTLADGSDVTVASTGAGANKFVDDFNADADVNGYLYAYRIGTDKVAITSYDPGYIFSLTPLTADMQIDNYYIALYSKDVNVKFNVLVDTSYATVTKWNHLVLTGWTQKAINTTIIVDGTSGTTSENGANKAAFVTALNVTLNTLASGKAFATNGDATSTGKIYIWMDPSIDLYMYTAGVGSTVTKIAEVMGNGRYPYLTSEHLFKMFAESDHMGRLSQYVRRQQFSDVAYCKYVLTSRKTIKKGAHLASEMAMNEQVLVIILPKSEVSTLIYDQNAPNTDLNMYAETGQSSNDLDFEDVLVAWAGCAVANW